MGTIRRSPFICSHLSAGAYKRFINKLAWDALKINEIELARAHYEVHYMPQTSFSYLL